MTIVQRETSETRMRVELLDDSSRRVVATTIPFRDHMLVTLARYAGVGMVVQAEGDLRHHVIEDVAITRGAGIAARRPATAENRVELGKRRRHDERAQRDQQSGGDGSGHQPASVSLWRVQPSPRQR